MPLTVGWGGEQVSNVSMAVESFTNGGTDVCAGHQLHITFDQDAP